MLTEFFNSKSDSKLRSQSKGKDIYRYDPGPATMMQKVAYFCFAGGLLFSFMALHRVYGLFTDESGTMDDFFVIRQICYILTWGMLSQWLFQAYERSMLFVKRHEAQSNTFHFPPMRTLSICAGVCSTLTMIMIFSQHVLNHGLSSTTVIVSVVLEVLAWAFLAIFFFSWAYLSKK